ncbi:MAG: hypothetical protein KatS3mg011_2377 [Acidimicrobiia bacterium]|nr:MAG: hypothetical protein KatS3mg011_2377 [Acidimicrobiia bacterium]
MPDATVRGDYQVEGEPFQSRPNPLLGEGVAVQVGDWGQFGYLVAAGVEYGHLVAALEQAIHQGWTGRTGTTDHQRPSHDPSCCFGAASWAKSPSIAMVQAG